MKESMWGYYLIVLGIGIMMVMILLSEKTTTDQQDFYLAKEVSSAAMYDAIDFGYYKKYGELKINSEKFVENFIRRFAESASLNKKYKVNFYEIYEIPPAASIEIITKTNQYEIFGDRSDLGITTRLTSILELK